MELALGNFLTLRVPPGNSVSGPGYIQAPDNWSELRFQNFWIGQNAKWKSPDFDSPEQIHAFLPFGFSGAVLSRQGDNIEADLVFPNTDISRNFLDQAVRERWTAVVRVMEVTNLEDPNAYPTQLYRYKGIVCWRRLAHHRAGVITDISVGCSVCEPASTVNPSTYCRQCPLHLEHCTAVKSSECLTA